MSNDFDAFDMLVEAKHDYALGMSVQSYSEPEFKRLLDEYDAAIVSIRTRLMELDEHHCYCGIIHRPNGPKMKCCTPGHSDEKDIPRGKPTYYGPDFGGDDDDQ